MNQSDEPRCHLCGGRVGRWVEGWPEQTILRFDPLCADCGYDPAAEFREPVAAWAVIPRLGMTNTAIPEGEDMTKTTPPRALTLGEQRVRLTFNPGASHRVDAIKRAGADIIDLCEQIRTEEVATGTPRGEILRLVALAQTEAENAAMWAVKAATAE